MAVVVYWHVGLRMMKVLNKGQTVHGISKHQACYRVVEFGQVVRSLDIFKWQGPQASEWVDWTS